MEERDNLCNEWKQLVRCEKCKGTGIYVGCAEKDGYGIVCNICGGNGCYEKHIIWNKFTGKEKAANVKIVLEINPGIGVGEPEKYNFGGMPYDDWYNGKPFPPKSEMREYVCPRWWRQNSKLGAMERWEECGCSHFSICDNFINKSKCWDKYDKEEGK